jgi:hypothetical protein
VSRSPVTDDLLVTPDGGLNAAPFVVAGHLLSPDPAFLGNALEMAVALGWLTRRRCTGYRRRTRRHDDRGLRLVVRHSTIDAILVVGAIACAYQKASWLVPADSVELRLQGIALDIGKAGYRQPLENALDNGPQLGFHGNSIHPLRRIFFSTPYNSHQSHRRNLRVGGRRHNAQHPRQVGFRHRQRLRPAFDQSRNEVA